MRIEVNDKVINVGQIENSINQGEERAGINQFVLPSNIDGVDLRPLHYILKGVSDEYTIAVQGMEKSTTTESVILQWTVTGEFTAVPGNLHLIIIGSADDGSQIIKFIADRPIKVRQDKSMEVVLPPDEINQALAIMEERLGQVTDLSVLVSADKQTVINQTALSGKNLTESDKIKAQILVLKTEIEKLQAEVYSDSVVADQAADRAETARDEAVEISGFDPRYLIVNEITANTDLNTITKAGLYFCYSNTTVETLRNCPTKIAFFMFAGRHTVTGWTQLIIEHKPDNTHKIFNRNIYGEQIGAWQRIYSTANKPTAEEVGAAPTSHDHTALQGMTVVPPLNFLQAAYGNASSVLDAATVQGMCENRLWFYPSENISFEESTDGSTFTSMSVTTTQKQKLLSMNLSGEINFKKGKYYRITINNNGTYVYLDTLYLYMSTKGNDMKVKIEKRKASNKVWSITTDYTNGASGWPTHFTVRHNRITHHTNTNDANANDAVRVTLYCEPSTNNYGEMSLYRLGWYGAYPAGKNTIYDWDENKNVTFPAKVSVGNNPANEVYHKGNKPTPEEIGAAPAAATRFAYEQQQTQNELNTIAMQQLATQAELNQIEAQQAMTDLELMMMEGKSK